MQPDSDLSRIVHLTREQAQDLRQSAKERLRRAESLIAHARTLCARHRRLEAKEAKAQFQAEPQTRHQIHALRLEVLEQLRQSLADLETIRMTPGHESELRDLKEDIRKSIERAETTKESKVQRLVSRVSVL